ncbi:MAG: InlB B-repeat-containing protein [Clostridia bacterium]|nr:InlB B-repeat-containing protein [Clostridia bacterium]
MSIKGLLKRTAAAALALLMLAAGSVSLRAAYAEPSSEPDDGQIQDQAAPVTLDADRIIVQRALRLAFLGQEQGRASWTPRYSFLACNSDKSYSAGQAEFSMPYSRSALFNTTEFVGQQQYIGWVDADSGATPSYAYTIANFLRCANTPGSAFDRAARAAVAANAKWGALLGSDCSAFLSYAWQIPHMTTFMFTSDAVDWNICRIVPATKGHESRYSNSDLLALEPGDAMVCANVSGRDEHGNPLYRGHCVIITDITLDANGKPIFVDTVEEIAPRAIAKHRTAEEFLKYANKLPSSGAYYKFYRLISKSHLKLELEITLDPAGGDPIPESESVKLVFARDAQGNIALYDEVISFAPTRAGAEFIGWGLYENGDDIIAPGTPIELLFDHTLYARWR